MIIRNSAVCLRCNTEIESIHRHDFVKCYCADGIFVDGGHDYIRHGCVYEEDYVNTSIEQDGLPFDPD